MTKKIARVWYFPSKSKPNDPPHETLQYEDGTTSCGCRGWCQHVASDGTRTCAHTRKVDSGLAGPPAHDYTTANKPPVKQTPVYTAPAKSPKKVKPAPKPAPKVEKDLVSVVRKIQWD